MFPQASFSTIPMNLKWQTETVAQGESLTGIYAGPMRCVRTHWNGKQSRPCLSWITDGKLTCLCTLQPLSIRTIGYVPLITPQSEKFVVIVSATVGTLLNTINPGRLLRFARPKKAKRPLSVSLIRDEEVPESFVKRLRPACTHDISEYLCHLWQNQPLTEHFGFEFRPSLRGEGKLNEDPSGSH